ncbi:alpha/beta fold hydrolase [Buchnera aphidicola]|nr:alpha/beta fold hydrolase [Buchnera aphidicola]
MKKIIHQSIFGKGKIHLVFLHGWGLYSMVWNKIIPILKPYFTLHIIDLPGFGKNINCPIMNLDQISIYLINTVKNKAIWIGWSMSGLIVHYLGLNYPHNILAVIYITSSPFFIQTKIWPGIPINLLKSIKKKILINYTEFLMQFNLIHVINVTQNSKYNFTIKKNFFQKYPNPRKQAIEIGYQWLKKIDYRTIQLSKNIPILQIYGELDNLVPIQTCQIIQSLRKNYNSIVIDGAKHAPFLSHPNIFCNILQKFIKDLYLI